MISNCPICLDAIGREGAFVPSCCDHALCGSCATELVDKTARDEEGVRCPSVDCRRAYGSADVREAGGAALAEIVDRLAFNRAVDNDPALYRCHTDGCDFVAEWLGDGEPKMTCLRCDVVSCLECHQVWHPGVPCARPDVVVLDEATRSLIASARIRICEACKNGVLKSYGCDKVRCRCGYEFCFRCGTPGAKCSCTSTSHMFWDNIHQKPFRPSMFWEKTEKLTPEGADIQREPLRPSGGQRFSMFKFLFPQTPKTARV